MRYWIQEHLPNDEQVIIFESLANRAFCLASNYPYEVYFDGEFVGSGGLRCPPGVVYQDEWNARQVTKIVVRLHYLSAKKSSVLYRCLFDDPFFEDVGDAGEWKAYLDCQYRFASKICSQLPRQNVVCAAIAQPVTLVEVKNHWITQPAIISLPVYETVTGQATDTLGRHGDELRFAPEEAEDIAEYVQQYQGDMTIHTYDMQKIALHKVFVDNRDGKFPVVLVYSEVPRYTEVWRTTNRRKVHMADVIAAGITGSPFGERGCRYVHVLSKPGNEYRLKFLRRIYPLVWKAVENDMIVEACKNNLVACVDGGVVDTCWRERAQWVGDLRMSAIALEKLTHNGPKVVEHALSQIATSYDPKYAMVQGAWPIEYPGFIGLLMPTYHLAYCLTVARHGQNPQLLALAEQSLRLWKTKYADCATGLVGNLPGWHFVDWDSKDDEAVGRNKRDHNEEISIAWHAVVNAWYYEACKVFKIPTFRVQEYDEKFYLPSIGAYAMHPGSKPSVHATAAALGSLDISPSVLDSGIAFLQSLPDFDKRVTMYYGYFVAKAFARKSSALAREFIAKFYGPVAEKYGTIYEKTSDAASLAHGWSIGIVDFLIGDG